MHGCQTVTWTCIFLLPQWILVDNPEVSCISGQHR